ncbi:MAG: YceD family protein [Gammaproteobacteria bacterium]
MTGNGSAAKLACLMSPELPQSVDLSQLADANETLSGIVQVGAMGRLRSAVMQVTGPVAVNITFSRDDDAAIYLSGDCRVTVGVQCQRCLLPMQLELHSDIAIVVVNDEAGIEQVQAEPLINPGNKLDLTEFVEDEILLALPIAPMHPVDECDAARSVQADGGKPDNPFAVLKDLLNTEKP